MFIYEKKNIGKRPDGHIYCVSECVLAARRGVQKTLNHVLKYTTIHFSHAPTPSAL